MRKRLPLLASLSLNILLAWLLWNLAHQEPAAPAVSTSPQAASDSAQIRFKTNVVVRRQFFHWSELESTNYVDYIANLRAIGCPEPTIRDIILAEINAHFRARLDREALTSASQWWKSEPDPDLMDAAFNKVRAINAEKKLLLAELLGPGAGEEQFQPERFDIRFTGPLLSGLDQEARQAVGQFQALQSRLAQERADGGAGLGELMAQERAARDQLRAVLSPEQMREVLLRFSDEAQRMRDTLGGFEATPGEFEKMFEIRDRSNREMESLLAAGDPASLQKAQSLREQMAESLGRELGPERHNLYLLTQDPQFQQARSEAMGAGATPEQTYALYQLNRELALERTRIQNDPSLDEVARASALAAVGVQRDQAARQLLAKPETPPLPPIPGAAPVSLPRP